MSNFPVAFLTVDVTLPSGKRLHYVLDVVRARQFIFGRSSEIFIEDPMVSQRHALICFDMRRGWELLDLNSTNGTYLNGKPVHPRVSSRFDHVINATAGDGGDAGRDVLTAIIDRVSGA